MRILYKRFAFVTFISKVVLLRVCSLSLAVSLTGNGIVATLESSFPSVVTEIFNPPGWLLGMCQYGVIMSPQYMYMYVADVLNVLVLMQYIVLNVLVLMQYIVSRYSTSIGVDYTRLEHRRLSAFHHSLPSTAPGNLGMV